MTEWQASATLADVSQSANIIGTAEAARILGWSLAKVKRETLAGRLPHQAKLDGRTGAYLFSRDTVEFIARTQRPARQAVAS